MIEAIPTMAWMALPDGSNAFLTGSRARSPTLLIASIASMTRFDPICSPVPFGGRTIYLSSCISSMNHKLRNDLVRIGIRQHTCITVYREAT
jgi:hypothetical protein